MNVLVIGIGREKDLIISYRYWFVQEPVSNSRYRNRYQHFLNDTQPYARLIITSQNEQKLVYFRQQDTSTLDRYENVQQQYSVHDRKPCASHN